MKSRVRLEKYINFSLISNCIIFNTLAGCGKGKDKKGGGGCSGSGKDKEPVIIGEGKNEQSAEELAKKKKEAEEKAEKEKKAKEEAERKAKELKSVQDEFNNKLDKIFNQILIINDPEKYKIFFENKIINKSDIENCKHEEIDNVRNKLTQLENEVKNTYIQIQNKIIEDIKSIDKKLEDLKNKGEIPLFEKNPNKEEDVKDCIFDDLNKLKNINKLYNDVIFNKKIINLESPTEVRNFLLSEIEQISEMEEIFGKKNSLDDLKKEIEKKVKDDLKKEDLKNISGYIIRLRNIQNNLNTEVTKFNSEQNKIIKNIEDTIEKLKIKIDYFANIDSTYEYEAVKSKLTIKNKKTDKDLFEKNFTELKNKNDEKIKEYKTKIIELITKLNEKYFNGKYIIFKLDNNSKDTYEKYKVIDCKDNVNKYSELLKNIVNQIKKAITSMNSNSDKLNKEVEKFSTLLINDRYLKNILSEDFGINKIITLENIITGFDTENTQYFLFNKECTNENTDLDNNLNDIMKKQESNEFIIEDQIHEIILELNKFITKYNKLFDKINIFDYFKGSFDFNDSDSTISNVKNNEFLGKQEIKLNTHKILNNIKIVNEITLQKEYLDSLNKGDKDSILRYKNYNTVSRLGAIVEAILDSYNLTKKSLDDFIVKLNKIHENNLDYYKNKEKSAVTDKYDVLFSEYHDYSKTIEDLKSKIKNINNVSDFIKIGFPNFSSLVDEIIFANYFCMNIFKDKELTYNKDGKDVKIKILNFFVNNFEFFKNFEDFYFFYSNNTDMNVPEYEGNEYTTTDVVFKNDMSKKLKIDGESDLINVYLVNGFKKLFNIKEGKELKLDENAFNYKYSYNFVNWFNNKMKEKNSAK